MPPKRPGASGKRRADGGVRQGQTRKRHGVREARPQQLTWPQAQAGGCGPATGAAGDAGGQGFTWEGRLPEEGKKAGQSWGRGLGAGRAGNGRAALSEKDAGASEAWPLPSPPACPRDRPALPWTPGPSAGIGRTGCFIATRIGCQQLKAQGEVDVLGIVCQLRLDRWALRLQTFPMGEKRAPWASGA